MLEKLILGAQLFVMGLCALGALTAIVGLVVELLKSFVSGGGKR